MSAEFWKWLLGVGSSTGILMVLAVLMRDTVARFFSRAVEHTFDKKLEVFKTTLKDNEKELENIRSFLVSSHKDRDSSLQNKRFEAAETLMRARDGLAKMTMLTEYMKILDGDSILKNGDDKRITDFIEVLIRPFDIDEQITKLGGVDKTVARLYLSDKSLKMFNAYEEIVLQAALMMKLYSLPIRDKGKMIKSGGLSKTISDLLPLTKESFDEWGDGYAYHWTRYFYDEILRSLRLEVAGMDDPARDAKAIERLSLDSRQAQLNIRASLAQAGLPESLVMPDGAVAPASAESNAAAAE